jgi:hypothetical protein
MNAASALCKNEIAVANSLFALIFEKPLRGRSAETSVAEQRPEQNQASGARTDRSSLRKNRGALCRGHQAAGDRADPKRAGSVFVPAEPRFDAAAVAAGSRFHRGIPR